MTDTEEFWRKDFGNRYHKRQGDKGSVRSNMSLFGNILNCTDGVETVIEFGAGVGLNLEAISAMYPEIQTTGIEINEEAAKQIPADYVFNINMLDYDVAEHGQADLVFTKGVGVHVDPSVIGQLYDKLYEASNKYILMAEYYSPERVEVSYRGHEGKLWKADFYGEMTRRYQDLELVASGFVGYWEQYPQDSINWWIWKK